MNNYLDDLFERLSDESLREGLELPEGTTYSSELTVSWEARDEARALTDPKWIKPIKHRLENEKKTIEKIHILHVLIPLADKNNDHSIADYIINFVKTEKTRWVREVALSSLSDTSLEIQHEHEYVFELVEHKDWQIKRGALALLKKFDMSYSDRVEKLCIELIKINIKKPYNIDYVCNALFTHGTKNCVPVIKEIIQNNSKAFVIGSALSIIHRVSGKEELDFFIEYFKTNRNNDMKSTMTYLICHHGNIEVIDLLIKRAKTILLKKRKSNVHYCGDSKPELVMILEFVSSFDSDKHKKLIEFIKTKKMDYLDETELKWFDENINQDVCV